MLLIGSKIQNEKGVEACAGTMLILVRIKSFPPLFVPLQLKSEYVN
jgi:hypothetical protein